MVQRVLEFGGGSIIIRRFKTVKMEVRKKVETSEKYRDTQSEKGNSKIVGYSPWGPQKGFKKFKNVFKKSVGDTC